eukprot:2330402-Pyramimonas_sp.AAC.1
MRVRMRANARKGEEVEEGGEGEIGATAALLMQALCKTRTKDKSQLPEWLKVFRVRGEGEQSDTYRKQWSTKDKDL